jgi:hypothetical protein
MRAYLAAGDRSAAEEVFMSYAKALDELDQDDPSVDAQTLGGPTGRERAEPVVGEDASSGRCSVLRQNGP